jgi:hypothetical protein
MKLFGIFPFLALFAMSAAKEQSRPTLDDGSRNTAQTAAIQKSESIEPEASPDNASQVPEPNAASLIGAFGFLALLRRRRK